MNSLVWLRSDLRAQYNSPLSFACDNHSSVSAIFFVTPDQWQHYNWADCRVDLLCRRLVALEKELADFGIKLNLVEVKGFAEIPAALEKVCRNHDISHLYFNAEYELDERRRDKEVKARMSELGVQTGVFHDTCMVRPDKILNKQNLPYKVYSRYFQTWYDQLRQSPYEPKALSQPKHTIDLIQEECADLEVLSCLNNSAHHWPADTDDILLRVRAFYEENITDYKVARDFPALDLTSQLSPYLAFGAVSPRQLYQKMLNEHLQGLETAESGVFTWLKELAWRDFYRYVMFHFPHVCMNRCFVEKYDKFPWSNNKAHFEAWCQGKTGYPIVDAAMRCLNQTGWMHNRLRMIVASFLTKHLRLPWRWGEDYFMSQLIDGDFASNNGGWQWAASVGTDAVPYFRIFNPTAQSKKFDEQGRFIQRWVPELNTVPVKYIHEPAAWEGFRNLNYAQPIVVHKDTVKITKELFFNFNQS